MTGYLILEGMMGKDRWMRGKIWAAAVLLLVQLFGGMEVKVCAADFILEKESEDDFVPEELQNLHAQSAVLMDADSGRILFEHNGDEKRAMASTTKILTCILALEYGDLEAVVTASKEAAGQPKVHLGMEVGEQFWLKDLLYSLMLESHNDTAVAVAETVSGSVEQFAVLMNKKAREIGCRESYFITPNGLDRRDEKDFHSTTAAELSNILRYCITQSPMREKFLEITGTLAWDFQNVDGTRHFSCRNHNLLLQTMEGAITGKTGFTSEAGYCYTGAVKRDDRTFIVTLLGCGWPGHKNWKWQDADALIRYAFGHYQYREVAERPDIPAIEVKNGCREGLGLFEAVYLQTWTGQAVQNDSAAAGEWEETAPDAASEDAPRFLLRDDEEVQVTVKVDAVTEAPVAKGDIVGMVSYLLHGERIAQRPIYAGETVRRIDFHWVAEKLIEVYLMQ